MKPYEPAITDASVCHTPFGSAVDPDVWYSHRAGSDDASSAPTAAAAASTGSPTRQRVVALEDLESLRLGDRLEHRAVVEAPERGRAR